MKTRLILAGLTTLSLLAQAPAPTPARPAKAHGQASAAVTQALTQMEEAWNTALLKSDVAALGKILAEEYVSIDRNGTQTDRRQAIADVASGAFKVQAIALSQVNIRDYGSLAIATGSFTIKATFKEKAIDEENRFTDVWIKREGRWQAISSHESPVAKF